jgi:hypothetical protein
MISQDVSLSCLNVVGFSLRSSGRLPTVRHSWKILFWFIHFQERKRTFMLYDLISQVQVDDFLPCDTSGRLICAHSTRGNEFWVSLVEKAFLKVHGGYDFQGSNSEVRRWSCAVQGFRVGLGFLRSTQIPLKVDWQTWDSSVGDAANPKNARKEKLNSKSLKGLNPQFLKTQNAETPKENPKLKTVRCSRD